MYPLYFPRVNNNEFRGIIKPKLYLLKPYHFCSLRSGPLDIDAKNAKTS